MSSITLIRVIFTGSNRDNKLSHAISKIVSSFIVCQNFENVKTGGLIEVVSCLQSLGVFVVPDGIGYVSNHAWI